MERPDLSQVDPQILAYIRYLEAEIAGSKESRRAAGPVVDEKPNLEPSEPPTTLNLITLTRQGIAKRTPRHLYSRQRRAGMGIFDLETPANQQPDILTIADESQSLIIFTNKARAFRLLVNRVSEGLVRDGGQSLLERLPLEPDEVLSAVLPDQATGYIALVSQKGMVRTLRHHLFGEYLKPGTTFFNYRDYGPLAAACWTPGDADLLIATRSGLAIRFSEKLVPPQGISGMRVDPSDVVVGITSVTDYGRVFFLGADGKGATRLMSGFNPNKSPGGSGKLAMKTSQMVSGVAVEETDDLFIISQLGKIIRFSAGEVPSSDGVVQGVNCISLRGDEASAVVKSSPVTAASFYTA